MPFKPPKSYETWISLEGVEYLVEVEMDYQPEEYDTNTAEGVEITSVCILQSLSLSDIKDLEVEALEHIHSMAEAYYEGEG